MWDDRRRRRWLVSSPWWWWCAFRPTTPSVPLTLCAARWHGGEPRDKSAPGTDWSGRTVGRSSVGLSSVGRPVGRPGQSLNDAPPAAHTYWCTGCGAIVSLRIGGGAGLSFQPPRRGHTVKARAGAHVLPRDRGRWPETFWFGGPRAIRPPTIQSRPSTAATPWRARSRTRCFNNTANDGGQTE